MPFFSYQFLISVEPLGVETAGRDRVLDRAPRLGPVSAIGKSAGVGQRGDVVEHLGDALRGIDQLELTHPGGVEQPGARSQSVQRPARRRVPAFRVGLTDRSRWLELRTGEAVDEGRFPNAGRPQKRHRLTRLQPRTESGDIGRTAGIDRHDEEPGYQAPSGREVGPAIGGEVGLGDDDDGGHLGLPGDRQISFEPSRVEFVVRRRHQEDGVDIRREQLDLAAGPRAFALEEGATVEQASRPVGDAVEQEPIADGGRRFRAKGRNSALERRARDLERAAVDRHDPDQDNGLQVGRINLRGEVGIPSQIGELPRVAGHPSNIPFASANHRGVDSGMTSPVISVSHLGKRYGSTVAVDDVSLTVQAGEIFGLIGPNGAGKTTTMECVQGLRKPDRGTMTVLGLDPERDASALRQRIGVQHQEANLQKRIKVWEAVDLWATLYPRAVDSEALLIRLGLESKRNAWFMTLSGGQKQRLFIALALIHEPEVVFLDELTTGLDPQARRAIWELIADIRRRGTTVFLTTHLMEEAERLCDRVAIIEHGRVIAMGTPADLVLTHCPKRRVVFTSDGTDVAEQLKGVPAVRSVTSEGSTHTLHGEGDDFVTAVIGAIAQAGIRVRGFRTESPTLEDVFLKLTGHGIRD